MLFTDIEKCSINVCPEHDCKAKMRFIWQCDHDRCDLCTRGYNCKRCRKYDDCPDGCTNGDIQRAKRCQLNEQYKDAPGVSPVITIKGLK